MSQTRRIHIVVSLCYQNPTSLKRLGGWREEGRKEEKANLRNQWMLFCCHLIFLLFSFFLFLFLFLFFSYCHLQHMKVPRHRSNWGFCCQPMPQPQQHRIQAVSVTYTTALGNTIFLTALSEARDRTCILMYPSRVLNPLSHNRNSLPPPLFF